MNHTPVSGERQSLSHAGVFFFFFLFRYGACHAAGPRVVSYPWSLPEVFLMLGIPDPQIWIAYLLCIALALACIIYGLLNWNNGGE